jgi:DHA3 family tetracycline resistance protein-like MFS transporter
MPERHFTPAPREDRTPWQQMGHTMRGGVRAVRLRPVLRSILAIAVFCGIFSAGFDRLWPYHLLHTFTFPSPGGLTVVVWFGIIEAGINVTNLCGTEVARRLVDTNSHRAVAWALFAMDGLAVACAAAFAVAGQFALALGVFWLFTAARGPRMPLERIWMNQNLESGMRATVFSMRAQVGTLAEIAGGPILGAIATAFTARAALLAAAAILSPTLLLYARALRRDAQPADPTAPRAQLPIPPP